VIPAGYDAWVVGDEPCVAVDASPEMVEQFAEEEEEEEAKGLVDKAKDKLRGQ
jgi:hypothetical protein